ncbi:unnamed protein product [marine sediment metagenome]|uniref:Sulfatase N-terminal domain-containing protein n=1 Tax=marine sediment metagenome TaxID=412755 RepID=X0Z268_9ZZZZ
MTHKEIFKGKILLQCKVVVILLDDTGFSHLGCYGSSIDTPNMDKLAKEGLRYTNCGNACSFKYEFGIL